MAHFDVHRLDTGVLVIAQELSADHQPTGAPLWSGEAADREAALQHAKAAWLPIYAAQQQAQADADAAEQARLDAERAAAADAKRQRIEAQAKQAEQAAIAAQAAAKAKADTERQERDVALVLSLTLALVQAGKIAEAKQTLREAPDHPVVARTAALLQKVS